MTFLKALTVFIVCISIFKVTISKTTIVENKKNSTDYNVLLTGTLICPSCETKNYVTVYPNERDKVEWINKSCNETFYIKKYLEDPHQEDYKAGFYFFCGSYLKAKVENKNPNIVENISGTFVYHFGYINLKTTEKKT